MSVTIAERDNDKQQEEEKKKKKKKATHIEVDHGNTRHSLPSQSNNRSSTQQRDDGGEENVEMDSTTNVSSSTKRKESDAGSCSHVLDIESPNPQLSSPSKKKKKKQSTSNDANMDSAEATETAKEERKAEPTPPKKKQKDHTARKEEEESDAATDKSHNQQPTASATGSSDATTLKPQTASSSKKQAKKEGRKENKKEKQKSYDGKRSSKHQKKEKPSNMERSTGKREHASSRPRSATEESINNHPPPSQKRPPTMDLMVHRIRHLQFHPKPILCMRTTPPGGTAHEDFVAVSRENGSIELKSPLQKLRTVATIAGYRDKPVNVLAWTCGFKEQGDLNNGDVRMDDDDGESSATPSRHVPILVGGSRDGSVFMVDFCSGKLAGVIPSGGGAVFALASLCQRHVCTHRHCSQLVAAGCQDGAVRIFRVDAEEERLDLVSTVPSAGHAVLSLTWQRNGPSGATVLFAGVADGTIRRYDSSSGRGSSTGSPQIFSWTSTLRMTVECYGRATPTRVWALATLSDGTLISGDSLGHIQFWDGNTGTLEGTFDQNDNKADVLDLAVTANECKVFASGVDSRVVCIERHALNDTPPTGPNRWVLSHAQRPHTHDVHSLTIYRKRRFSPTTEDGKYLDMEEILCTGGVDTKLCSYVVNDFQRKRPRVLHPWTQNLISLAKARRVFTMMREGSIDLYSLQEKPASLAILPVHVPEDERFLGTLEVKSKSNIVCSAISDDGRFLAVADASSLIVFKLTYDMMGMQTKRMKLDIPDQYSTQVQAMGFSKRCDHLFWATSDGWIHFIALEGETGDSGSTKIQSIESGACLRKSGERSPVLSLSTNKTDEFFFTLRSGMFGTDIEIFRRQADGSFRHWYKVPDLGMPACATAFLDGDGTTELVVASSNFGVRLFDVAERQMAPWGGDDEGGVDFYSALPPEISQRNDFPVRFCPNPAIASKFLMASFGAFVPIDRGEKFPTICNLFPERHVRGRKHQRNKARSHSIASEQDKDDENQDANDAAEKSHCTLCLGYNSMLFLDFVDTEANEIMVVEQPWLDIIATFPDALQRRVYGT